MNTKTTNKLKKITAIGFITLFAAFGYSKYWYS